MSDVAPEDSGLASGVVNTSFMMGVPLAGHPGQSRPPRARRSVSYRLGNLVLSTAATQAAFFAATLFAVLGVRVGAVLLPSKRRTRRAMKNR